MKKRLILALSALCVATLCTAVGCGDEENNGGNPQNAQTPAIHTILNGGFESADLSGWTVEYGNAFDDSCVSSVKEFVFDYDDKQNRLPINQTGNWYLCGKGFDGKNSNARTGAIRSTKFVLDGDGIITMKLAGGATVTGKGTNVDNKARERLCYVGVYSAKDDRMLAMQTNEYFLEHTESYVNTGKYSAGVYNTDNFYE